MGFNVVYFPPISPVGRNRAARARTTRSTRAADDVGSPWAIGAAEGGHDAILPELGTQEDFRRFVQRAGDAGIDIALDIAFQCAPDHPWVAQHPEWFRKRADGSIQYAENPPKKYQDIYPFDFETDRLGAHVDRAGRGVRALDRARRAHFPRRQPAHQGVSVLGMGDSRASAASTRTSSSCPRRSPARA